MADKVSVAVNEFVTALKQIVSAAVQAGVAQAFAAMPTPPPSLAPVDYMRDVLNERDAGRYLDLTQAYLRVARRRGNGPAFFRIGRTIRYRIADLEDFLEQRRVPSRIAPKRTRRS